MVNASLPRKIRPSSHMDQASAGAQRTKSKNRSNPRAAGILENSLMVMQQTNPAHRPLATGPAFEGATEGSLDIGSPERCAVPVGMTWGENTEGTREPQKC
jgi:hypothetical protein